MADERKEEPQLTTAKDYFKGMGLNPDVDKNSFTEKDAIAILEKAASDLKARRVQAETAKAVIRQAWGIFKILA